MAAKGKGGPPAPVIVWGGGIRRPQAIHPPPENVPYLRGLATGLNGFAAQRRRSIDYYIRAFELDRESLQARRGKPRDKPGSPAAANPNRQPGDDDYMKPYHINKALTLELMMTCALFRLLSPTSVRANCRLRYGWPINFAPPRKPDIIVECAGFRVHVEVSAKMDMDDDYFKDELEGTLGHMAKQEVAWGLLVTEWDYKKARNSQAYKDFKSRRQEALAERHLIIMSLQEMAELSATLAFDADFNSGKKRLSPAQARELFEALHAAQEPKAEKKEKSKQKGATKKKKKVEINLRYTWVKATQRLLKE